MGIGDTSESMRSSIQARWHDRSQTVREGLRVLEASDLRRQKRGINRLGKLPIKLKERSNGGIFEDYCVPLSAK
jgi:hypothetical protein